MQLAPPEKKRAGFFAIILAQVRWRISVVFEEVDDAALEQDYAILAALDSFLGLVPRHFSILPVFDGSQASARSVPSLARRFCLALRRPGVRDEWNRPSGKHVHDEVHIPMIGNSKRLSGCVVAT